MKKAIKSIRQDSELKRVQDQLQSQISALSYGALVRIAAHRCIGKPTDSLDAIHKAPLKSSYGIPTSKVSKFIGREDIIKSVEQKLMDSSNGQNVVVLQSIGGQRKTQTTLQVCGTPEIRQYFKVILWINASTQDTTAEAFENFAQAMCYKGSSFPGSQSRIDFVKKRIEDLVKPSLLVFDNYDDLKSFQNIRQFFPGENRHAILLTSRNEDSTHLGESISLPGMSVNEASALLLHRAGLKTDVEATKHAEEVAHHLGYLPLALAQAGAYVKSRRIPLSTFIAHYNERASAVLKHTPKVWEYGISVFTTWEMSTSQYSDDKEEQDQIDRMLLFLSILHHETINEHYFGHILNCVQELPSWASMFETDGRWDPTKL